jgi:hypothetical protein
VGGKILFDPESKQCTAPTSVKRHRNIRGDKTAIELFVVGVRGWASWRWRQVENSQPT